MVFSCLYSISNGSCLWYNQRGLVLTMNVQYEIKQEGDAFYLYSIVETNFGGPAKNFIRMSATKKDLEKTIKSLKIRRQVEKNIL